MCIRDRKKIVQNQNIEWFERFRWFITTDGEIAVGGKDARSNEQVVKKYLKNNDRYAHADIHGAPSIVVKNINGTQPSEQSMLEACNFSLSYSKAWGARVSGGHSFWVENDKVSKTPNTGEFLAKGALEWIKIRGLVIPAEDMVSEWKFLETQISEDSPLIVVKNQ